MLISIGMALLGGAIIGMAASVLLYLVGRVCGISGIVGGLIAPTTSDKAWRMAFIAGLLLGGVILVWIAPASIQSPIDRSLAVVALAGFFVGTGTLMGGGCTSGHGVCGLTRFSIRSVIATLMFMATGALTASIIGWIHRSTP